jgi:hypothetical protein
MDGIRFDMIHVFSDCDVNERLLKLDYAILCSSYGFYSRIFWAFSIVDFI